MTGTAPSVQEAPTRPPLEIAATLWRMRADALAPLVGAASAFEIAQSRLPGMRMYSVHRASHVGRVLVSNQANYRKGPEYDLFARALGRGLVTSRDALWRRQRRLVQPLFAKRHQQPFASAMTAAAGDLCDAWSRAPDGARVDVWQEMSRLTLDVVGRALLGSDFRGRTAETVRGAVTAIVDELSRAGRSPLFWSVQALPGVTVEHALRLRPRAQRAFRAQVHELDAVVAATIARGRLRTRRDGPGDDLLSLLLEARDEETGAPMDARQLRDEVVTFLIAGHETTAAALTWMWWLLARHPAARDRLHAEVDAVLGGRTPTFGDADALPWTQATVKEAMRLYPPVWILVRRAVDEDVIGETRIPAGAVVYVLTWLTHRDPGEWSEPEAFDPARFLPGRERERSQHAFIPFSAGQRGCVGRSFALTEAVLLTATIAQRHVLDVDPAHVVTHEALLTLRPRGGMPMRLRHR